MAASFRLGSGGPSPNPATAEHHSQHAILRLMADGLSNREIAERVHLSENTVKTHIQEILRKLRARNRVQAAVRAVRERWL